jgi:hypothetical protein
MKLRNRQTLLCTALIFAGCGKPSAQDFVPAETSARQALEGALDAWKKGSPPKQFELAEGVNVQPQDAQWQAGKRLTSYTIVEEMTPSEHGPRRFAVKLAVAGIKAEQNVVFFVLGKDPIWVLREEDYNRASGM